MQKKNRKHINKTQKSVSQDLSKSTGQSDRNFSQIRLLACLLIVVCAAVLIAHWPALSAKAIYFDDDQYFMDNLLVKNPGWASTKQFLTEIFEPSTVRGYYQPLSMISLMLDCALVDASWVPAKAGYYWLEVELQPSRDYAIAEAKARTAVVVAE